MLLAAELQDIFSDWVDEGDCTENRCLSLCDAFYF